MSWDIFVQDLPPEAQKLTDIPDDFRPKPLGSRAEVIAKIKAIVPQADFANPAWGIIDGGDFSIEVNMGEEDPVTGFAFHVRGSDAAIGVVAAIVNGLNVRAIDCQNSDFFKAGPEAVSSFQAWRSYRDRVVGEAGRYCDFHALRHTFISRLARAGVSPAVAKELARHSTITLTIDHYTHVQDEQRAALAKLPPMT